MGSYEKKILYTGGAFEKEVTLVFHGISHEALINKRWSEDYKMFDDVNISGWWGRRFIFEKEVSGKMVSHTESRRNLFVMAFGDVSYFDLDTSWGPTAGSIRWRHLKQLYSNAFIVENYIPIGYDYEATSESDTVIFAPLQNTNEFLTALDTPSTVDIYNVLYFADEHDINEFVEKWKDGDIDTSLLLNYGADEESDEYDTSKQYWFYNSVSTYLKDPSGRYTIKQGTTYIKATFDTTDKRLYFTGSDTTRSNLVLKNYEGVSVEYSTDNGASWHNADSLPSNYAYVVKGSKKVGGAVLNGSFSTNIPVFSDNEKGQEYEDGFIDASEADNVDNLSKDEYSPVTPTIKSGQSETVTTLGSGVAMDKMTMFYKLTAGQLATFGATLFNADNADAVATGTKLVGSDALNSIVGLRYYPFDISKVASVSGTYYIKLGSWDSGCASSGVITQNNGVIDMGETVIKPMFNNFLDYTNVSMAIYLPYIGVREVDIKNVLGKTLKVQYIVDITTGKCNAMLYSNGLLFDSHEGTIARDCPVSGTDAQSYNTANRQASLSMTNTKISGVQSITSIMGAGLKDGLSGNVGGVVGDVGKAAAFSKTYGSVYDQAVQDVVNARNNLPTYFNGSSGGQLGEITPQYVYLIFAVNKTHIPANELEIIGRPSNNSGTVSQFYGFLSCDMVKMETMATTTEKEMINTMLSGGIYI